MSNFNKVLLMGNLTRDPELSYTPNQTAVVDFGIAVNRRWTGRDGNQREETCFVDCRAFGRQAENINKYLSKGRAVFLEGRLNYESWTAQDGSRRSKHRVTVESFKFLPRSSDSGARQAQRSEAVPDSGSDESGESYAQGQQVQGDDIPF